MSKENNEPLYKRQQEIPKDRVQMEYLLEERRLDTQSFIFLWLCIGVVFVFAFIAISAQTSPTANKCTVEFSHSQKDLKTGIITETEFEGYIYCSTGKEIAENMAEANILEQMQGLAR